MRFVNCAEMQEIEKRAFLNGVDQEALMLKAGMRIAEAILNLAPYHRKAIAYIGKGNNGGDALVALKHLREEGWQVFVRLEHDAKDLGKLSQRQFRSLGSVEVIDGEREKREPFVAIDGLVGIGASGVLRKPLDELALEINTQSINGKATVFSIDIPSGVDGDTGEVYEGAVMADYTLTIGQPKYGLIVDSAVNHVGRLELILLEELSGVDVSGYHLILPSTVERSFLRQSFDRHKGDAGRVGVIAGSRGMLGAAELCVRGALAAGAGLVTLFALEENYELLAARVPAEVMVKPIQNFSDIGKERLDVLVVGPGLSIDACFEDSLSELIKEVCIPVVIDGGGIDLLKEKDLLGALSERDVVTPHPGEMRRLLGELQPTRLEDVESFTKRSAATLLYKGARTIVSGRNWQTAFNTTGNPGMASGGQGDTLSGVLGALIGQGVSSFDAAKVAAWLCGRASEIAIMEIGSPLSLTASHTADFLPQALKELSES